MTLPASMAARALAMGAIGAAASVTVSACPSCADAIAAGPSQALGAGLSYTTIGLVILPLAVVAAAGVIIRRLIHTFTADQVSTTRSDINANDHQQVDTQ